MKKLILLALIAGFLGTGGAYGDPPGYRGKHVIVRPRKKTEVRREPKRIVALPRGHTRMLVGGNEFFYHGGVFYRHTPSGYFVIPGPVGARIRVLPQPAVRVRIGSSLFFTYYGTYYRYEPRERVYIVVAPPKETVQDAMVMTNGLTLIGQYLGGDEYTIDFQIGADITEIPIENIVSITFAPKEIVYEEQ